LITRVDGQVVLAREHARFAVVDQQEVPLADGFEQFGAVVADPVIHGVAAHELHRARLRAHALLQRGLDVAEQEVWRGTVRFRQLGIEAGENVEVRGQGGAVVHVGGVDSGPEEGLAGDPLEPVEIDLTRAEQVDILLLEIVAHDGDDLHRREIAGGERDVGGRAAKHAVHFPVRRFDAVVCHGTHDDQGHVKRIVATGV